MLLRKDHAGGVGPYNWEHDGDVVDVPDKFGLQLLAIGHAGFSYVREAPVEVVSEVTEAPEISEVVDPAENAAPKSGRGVKE